MIIKIIAIGKFKNNPYQEIFLNYQKMCNWQVTLKEIEIKDGSKNLSIKITLEKEEELILKEIPNNYKIICLDINGENLTSEKLADIISNHRDNSEKLCFVIGGSHGISSKIKKKSDRNISFGKITLPHMMARVILMEQIYRSFTIINNHPYHK